LTGVDYINRYHRLYREVVGRNARTVAKWQCFGFMNGVLNTDNTHIMGLSLDFGPFSFMDVSGLYLCYHPTGRRVKADWVNRTSTHTSPPTTMTL